MPELLACLEICQAITTRTPVHCFVYDLLLFTPFHATSLMDSMLIRSSQFLQVRIAQGLVHLGKGLLTLNPYHSDRFLLSP